MHDLTEEISKASESEIVEILDAALERYRYLFPNWEISTISLDKDADRNRQLDRIIQVLQKMKTSP